MILGAACGYRGGKRVGVSVDLEHTDLPDPVAKTIEQLLDRIHELESEMDSVKKKVEEVRTKEVGQ